MRKRSYRKIEIGEQFGNLLTVEPKRVQKNSGWLCNCRCGKSVWIKSTNLTKGSSISCGCLKIGYRKNGAKRQVLGNPVHKYEVKANKAYGNLTAVEEIFVKNSKRWKFRCVCSNEIILQPCRVLGSKPKKSCGCKKGFSTTSAGITLHLFNRYKSGAKKRNLEFDLSINHFTTLIYSTCFYCSNYPNNKFKWRTKGIRKVYKNYNGVDRLDNKKGYNSTNCVTCCFVCNRMKNIMDSEAFLTKITEIYKTRLIGYKTNEREE